MKNKLSHALADMESAVNFKKVQVLGIDESATKIQRAARKMINRKNFRLSLYKLIMLKGLIENKVHKEKMGMLYAFE